VDTDSREQYDAGLKTFRDIVINSCKMNHGNEMMIDETAVALPDAFFVISNFSRKVLGQTGDGHFSPIGGELTG
jgi:hypothetical protein